MKQIRCIGVTTLVSLAVASMFAAQGLAVPPPYTKAPSSPLQIYYPPEGGVEKHEGGVEKRSGGGGQISPLLVSGNNEFPLTYDGGYTQHYPTVHVLFWGSNWVSYPGTREKILGLFSAVNGSNYGSILTQYFDYSGPIQNQTSLASSYIDGRIGHPTNIRRQDVKAELEWAITHVAGWNTGSLNDQFFVVDPPGTVTAEYLGCGFHSWDGTYDAAYASVQWPGGELESCRRGLEPWGSMQVTASHEWAEMATDPIPETNYWGWALRENQGEIGDLCNSQTPEEHAEIAPGIFASLLFSDYREGAIHHNNGCTVSEPPQRFTPTTEASNIGVHTATLHGSVRTAAWPAHYQFELVSPEGTTKLPAKLTEIGPSLLPTEVSAVAEGLKPNTTYHVRLSATSALTEPTYEFFELWSEKFAFSGGETQFTTPDWRPTITPEATTGFGVHGATLHASINPQGSATTYRFEYGTTTAYGTSVPVPDASIGSGTTAVKVSQALSGLGPEREYHYRVIATNAEGTTTGPDRTFSTLANAPTFVSSFGGKGTGNGQFTSPVGTVMSPGGIVVGGNGNLYATDSGGNRVEKFGPAGEYLSQFGTGGSGNGQFNAPLGIALDPSGHLFVADANNHRIEEVNVNGAYIAQFGPGEGSEPLYAPWDVVADKAGHVFAADPIRGAVYEYSVEGLGPEGNHLLAVIPYTLAEREGRSPIGLGYEPGGGNVWGVDASKTYVEQYMLNCGGCAEHPTLFTRFGTEGSGLGQLKQPYDVAVRPSGSLLVLDHGNNRVEQFSQTGELLANFGEAGSGAGQLSQPFSIAYGKGSIYVADAGNNRIERWTQVGPPEAITQAATAIGSSGATLNALIAPVGATTTYHFEYGTTTAYGTKAPAPDEAVGSGFEAVSKAKAISGLTAETTYHYRVVATSAEGTAYGEDMTFKTTK